MDSGFRFLSEQRQERQGDNPGVEEAKKHNRFYVIKRLGEHTNGTLTLANMMQHGLKWAPQGALNLSDKSYDELRKFIEDNF